MKRLPLALLTVSLLAFSQSLYAQGSKSSKMGSGTTTTTNSSNSNSSGSGKSILSGIADALGGNGNASGSGTGISSLSNSDIVSGLREALNVGAKNATSKLNATNGFFGNTLIKILMPPELKSVESTLRNYGMGSMVDRLILSMNRAAEDAAGKAVPIFVDAIKGITINDGLSILKGGNNAATNFLKSKTTTALTAAFKPVIENSLGKVGTTQLWSQVFTTYNKLPIVRNKVNPDLTGYVTDRALNGLFVTIADEEAKIRTDPASRVTDILRTVFGAK